MNVIPVSWVVPTLDNSTGQEFKEVQGFAVACVRTFEGDWVLLCFNKEDGKFEERNMKDIKGLPA